MTRMSETSPPCQSPGASQFDFWIGEWALTWPAEQTGGDAGSLGSGTNKIEKMFGNCVVSENFATSDGRYQGHSLSVYDARSELWRQTWVDTSGAYLSFTGQFHGSQMELRTESREQEGEVVVNRMVFREITDDSIRWEWQMSRDQGANWNDIWTIDYARISD